MSRAEPLFFGAGARLFGFHHAPAGEPRGAGVVLVSPFGHEALCAHRGYRLLAERLAAEGFAVLRFDLDGTGDSCGGDRDPGRVATWIAGVGAAMDELRARSGARDLSLFGVRLGALLALATASTRGDVTGLALLAPIVSGRAYLRELRALRLLAEKETEVGPRGRGERDEEAAGFLLTEATQAELGKLDALSLDPRGARVLVVPRDDVNGGEEKLARRLAARVRAAAGYAAMMQDPHKSIAPVPAFDAVVEWLCEAHPRGRATDRAEPAPPPRVHQAGDRVREELVRFGDDHRLFGVIASPSDGPRPREPAVLLVNAGAVHRAGPNRMYVTLARELAAEGFAVLRFDLGGIGDSRPAPGAPDNRVYSRAAVAEAQAAIRFLGTHSGASRFVIAGLCAGAYVSFHTALGDERVCGAVMINPQTFTWKEGDSLEVSRSRNYLDVQHYRRSLFQRQSWIKALRGDADLARAARAMIERGAILGRARLERLWAELHGTVAEDDVRGGFALLDRRGVRSLMLMSADDAGLDYLRSRLGPAAGRDTLTYRLHVVDGADHTFTPLWSQEVLRERVRAFVRELARAPEGCSPRAGPAAAHRGILSEGERLK